MERKAFWETFVAAAIEAYASVASASPGDAVDFYVRATPDHRHFTMQVFQRGLQDTLLKTAEGDAFVPGAQDDATLAVNGCDWPAVASCRMTVPTEWMSGYYLAKVSSGDQTAWIPFIVRAAAGSGGIALLKISDTTTQAYTAWGGRGFYTTPFSPKISFNRPYDDLSLYERYQLPFLQWAERNGFLLDLCSSLDLHTNPLLLKKYRLFISLGHDEYWSLEMRDQVEAFIASGGNACFLSANTCYWQIRFDLSDGQRSMTCYKEAEAGHPPDPERQDSRRVTTAWYAAPVSRPENSMTGVSYRNGAGWWVDPVLPELRYRGYSVARSSHWIFGGTGLSNGDTFGSGTSVDDTILGYETDAALIAQGVVPPVVTGADGTPKDFVVLAIADLRDWGPKGQGGFATMGTYRRNGTAFTTGTVNWAGGLSSGSPVEQITRNVLLKLTGDRSLQLALTNAGFEDWVGGLPTGWTLDGVGVIAVDDVDAEAAADHMRFADSGSSCLKVDASAGDTWVGQPGLSLDPRAAYGVGCWAKASALGATLRLQTTDTWIDLAVAEHSGSGEWEYLFLQGTSQNSSASVPARVKIQVAGGTIAWFDNVIVLRLS
ncbi:MAG TPA: N,N-dimethylformamidase beta subunit family domain-containing protein [Candidatus Tumulicola sp.]|nr:N,N-dimethylformamidase beta subunit family domain-containing protein [Candidatus Tumulicola sp.]